ncbi:prohibitin family protein [Bacillus subtilis]|uniref:prohibitin family protein n=1 Tax=Bacillus subtilis TaxID=1423 RepID=UPI002ECFE6F3
MGFYSAGERVERENKMKKYIKRGAFTVGGVTVALVLWFNFTETINQGHAGVVYSRSHGVEDKTLGQGLHFVNPIKRITEYPVSTEVVNYNKLSLATKDGKPLTVDITIEYLNNVEKLPYIYNKFKGQKPEAIEESWLKSRLKESALEVTSKYTILEVFQNREVIRTDILKQFQKDVKKHGFVIENVVFGTPHPDEKTQKAIQNVVDAQQAVEKLKVDKQKAQLEAERQKIEAQGKADAEIEKAKGEAESTKVKAQAEADANKLLNDSLTDKVLKKEELDARMKHGWVEIQGGTPLIETQK